MLNSVSKSNCQSEKEESHLHVFLLFLHSFVLLSIPPNTLKNPFVIPFQFQELPLTILLLSSLFEKVLSSSAFLKVSLAI